VEQAVEIADSMHSAGLYHSPDLYVKLIEALGRQQQWEKALELFLSMQVSSAAVIEALRPSCEAHKKGTVSLEHDCHCASSIQN